MTKKRSIFFDEWQACLRAHYAYVIHEQDMITLPTLREVLLNTGLSDNDLIILEDMPLDDAPGSEPDAAPVDYDDVDEISDAADAAPDSDADFAADDDADDFEADPDLDEFEPADEYDDSGDGDWDPPPDEDAPEQLSLF
jgi:hypothetical protein